MSGGGGGGGNPALEEEHPAHENHERYLLTYADMITLLLALFIVLFAIGQTDQAKFNEFRAGLAVGVRQPQLRRRHRRAARRGVGRTRRSARPTARRATSRRSSRGPASAPTGPWAPVTPARPRPPPHRSAGPRPSRRRHQRVLGLRRPHRRQRGAGDRPADLGAAHRAGDLDPRGRPGHRRPERGVVIQLSTDDVTFSSGSGELTAEGRAALDSLVPALTPSTTRSRSTATPTTPAPTT